MSSKKIILGVAAGVAALAIVGILTAKNKSKKKRFLEKAENAKDQFKGKLSELQRKAQKELSQHAETGDNLINQAKNRANDWIAKNTN
ncbi:hypothetical protein GV828_08590 [Flavobacterium sp. NST-5]|uniref:YtxH domain-containing protein n=1 Tax=Flavobacterium ichthyis TaxID=2698827 RepID=A0ABW9ZDS3_9FLAO|nr:hypothetical protein [Flavobacterium ichthyis]NBL65250.1 hypothetical protein [Flavobacterium ichthyis]